MRRSVNNGLGAIALSAIMAVTPLVPAAVSSSPPQWVWDEDGRVHDATGQYRPLTEEEACEMYGFCRNIKIKFASASSSSGDSEGSDGPSDGGGQC